MLSLILSYYRIKFIRPSLGFEIIIFFLKNCYWILRKRQPVDFRRFFNANVISNNDGCDEASSLYNLELIVVVSRKDFEVLGKTLCITLNSLRNFRNLRISLVVPERDLETAKSLFIRIHPQISIVSEFQVLNIEVLQRLTEIFSSRATWVYQQMLKLNALSTCLSEYAIILDADTVLLNSRNWICSNGHLLLCPSDEYNFSYYNFLQKIGVSDLSPNYTFVSHHMFYETKLVKEMLMQLNLTSSDQQIEAITNHASKIESSPICIDFELYGQWLTRTKPNRVKLQKWSNLGISRKYLNWVVDSKLIKWILARLYNSISFHSWS